MKPRIFNRNMEMVDVLKNASAVSYCRTHNDLFTASFQLPIKDPKNSLCDTHFIVDIFDGDVSKGKYRILDEPDTDFSNENKFIKYSCEHVIAFLLNDVIDGYLEIGGEGCNTRTVLEHLLAKQTTHRWVLGQCDFNYEFQYSWENTNLLDAIFSIPTCFADAYHWTYDTDSYPWTLNLIRQDTDRSCEIRRKRNMQQIKREKDSSALCTRLYCKGNGEGVNQLSIKDVNDGKPYIDADTIDTYGPLCSHYIDLTVTDAETLLAKGRAVLEEIKHPRYTYTAKAVDLAKITGKSWDDFDEGKYVHIIDDDGRLDIDAMIISVEKPDVDGDPLDMNIVISNKSSDVSSDIEDLSKRTAITAQYSQGATNLYSQQFADNADEDHPAVMKVYIPSECAKINSMLLSWSIEKFRAYSKGASYGGAVTSTSGGNGSTTISSGSVTSGSSYTYTGMQVGDAFPGHVHVMTHEHTVPGHTHTLESHTHEVNMPSHSHGISYGIYEGGKADNVTIKVDDTEIPAEALENDEMDIVQYLSKDVNGKIRRGTWHTIEIAPDSLARIEANLFVQTFVTSYSGGNY